MHRDRTAELRALLERRILIMDGAMGTMIQQHKLDETAYRGAHFAGCSHDVKGNNELLTLTQPTAARADTGPRCDATVSPAVAPPARHRAPISRSRPI